MLVLTLLKRMVAGVAVLVEVNLAEAPVVAMVDQVVAVAQIAEPVEPEIPQTLLRLKVVMVATVVVVFLSTDAVGVAVHRR